MSKRKRVVDDVSRQVKPKSREKWQEELNRALETPPHERGYEWWRNAPLPPTLSATEQDCRTYQIAKLNRKQLIELCETFVFGLIPHEHRPLSISKGMPAGTPRDYALKWRTRLATEEEKRRLALLIQGDPGWYLGREGGIGGSEKGAVTSLSHYQGAKDTFRKHRGLVADPAREPSECFFFDEGHYHETPTGTSYQIAMQCYPVMQCGIITHPRIPECQTSPDLLVYYPPYIVHTHWSKDDSVKGAAELKAPNFVVHSSRHVVSFPFAITPEYCSQQQDQSSCCQVDWNDFGSCWRAADMKPPITLPEAIPDRIKEELVDILGDWARSTVSLIRTTILPREPRVYPDLSDPLNPDLYQHGWDPLPDMWIEDEAPTGEMYRVDPGPTPDTVQFTSSSSCSIAKLIVEYLGKDWNQPIAYHVGEMLIMRNYRSEGFCREMYDRVQWHIRAVRFKCSVGRYGKECAQGPPQGRGLHHQRVVLLPLKRIDWVIHGTPTPPPYTDLFPKHEWLRGHHANMEEVNRGVLKGSFRQSATIRGVMGKHWTGAEMPPNWPWAHTWPEFYITVFVTAYPNSRPLGSDQGLTIDELDKL